jgi:hypothetical protein
MGYWPIHCPTTLRALARTTAVVNGTEMIRKPSGNHVVAVEQSMWQAAVAAECGYEERI